MLLPFREVGMLERVGRALLSTISGSAETTKGRLCLAGVRRRLLMFSIVRPFAPCSLGHREQAFLRIVCLFLLAALVGNFCSSLPRRSKRQREAPADLLWGCVPQVHLLGVFLVLHSVQVFCH